MPNIATTASSPRSIASRASRRSSRVAYVVRAVAPGHYVYPPATAEDMYRPERFGRTGFGEIEVKAK